MYPNLFKFSISRELVAEIKVKKGCKALFPERQQRAVKEKVLLQDKKLECNSKCHDSFYGKNSSSSQGNHNTSGSHGF
jgi:hypothetical protein